MSKVFEDKINQLEDKVYNLNNELASIKSKHEDFNELECKYNFMGFDADIIVNYISDYIDYKKSIWEHKHNCDNCKNLQDCRSLYFLELDSESYSDEELFEFKKDYLDSFKEKYK